MSLDNANSPNGPRDPAKTLVGELKKPEPVDLACGPDWHGDRTLGVDGMRRRVTTDEMHGICKLGSGMKDSWLLSMMNRHEVKERAQ